jgi:tetratricopeptide (TPR) repeat protein
MTTTGELFQRAMQCHQADQWQEAERLYQEVLVVAPDHVDALHLLGVLDCQNGRAEAATRRIGAAITILEAAGVPPAASHAALHLNLGNAWQAAGQLDLAIASYRQAIALDPTCADAYSNLGNVQSEQRDYPAAITSYQSALQIRPVFPEALFNLGNAHATLGDNEAAIARYREALRHQPNYAMALNNLANALQAAGRFEEALTASEEAIRHAPASAALLINLGITLRCLGRLDEAIQRYEQALGLDPNDPEAHSNLANAHYARGDWDDAAAGYRRAAALKPDAPEASFNLGKLLAERGDPDAAIACYRRALAIRPTLAPALFNLANLLQDQGRFDDALPTWRQLLALDPRHAEAHAGLGNGLHGLGRLDEALAAYRRALAIKPDLVEAHYNLANTLHDTGAIAAALDHYAHAVTLKPDYVEAHWNRSQALLLAGDFETGWTEYEWRWQRRYSQSLRRPFTAPLWRGEPLDGQRILLHAEQGLGDTLQFCRYATLVAARRPAAVVLEVPQPLVGVMTDSFADTAVRIVPLDAHFPRGDSLPEFDLHCPLLSLPLALGTTLDTIPWDGPYLRVNPAKAARWQRRLGDQKRPRIGLVWAGGVRTGNPEAVATDRRRSIALAQLAPLAAIPGVAWYSLQKGPPAAQAKEPPPGLALVDLMDEVEDFADTAALIAQLDLVISVDTSVAHLAAGLGKPVLLLSRFDGCWRWLLDRDDSPWYPTLRLYRQTVPGDWRPIIERLRDDLATRLATATPAEPVGR